MSGYNVEKRRLQIQADKLDEYSDLWRQHVSNALYDPEVILSADVFTWAGYEFAQVYNNILNEYHTFSGAVSYMLSQGSMALSAVAHNYGSAEQDAASIVKKVEPPKDLRGLLGPGD